MWIEKLSLTHFKNYEDGYFEFDPHVNCLTGENGSGKTNLLDAIYFLALTKSAFHNQDALSIQHGGAFFMLDGVFIENNRKLQITGSVQRGQRKVLMADKKPYDKLSEHIGRIPLVLIAPDDTDLIRDGSEERRKFFDGVLSQLDSRYLADFLAYNKLLAQRNALLKIFAERRQVDDILLQTYDEPMIALAQQIGNTRKSFLRQFGDWFQRYYQLLTGGREMVRIGYESDTLADDFALQFRQHKWMDLQAQRTGKGVHKDDYRFESEGVPVKKFGSQGQRKSFVIALRLAQFALLKEARQRNPILLLDDIFDKLDSQRILKLMTLINEGHFGQVFISDARPERLQKILQTLSGTVRYFELKKP